MKKLLGIVVLGLLKSYPINYRKTCTRLVPREINQMVHSDDFCYNELWLYDL
jgi:hypothetical protein